MKKYGLIHAPRLTFYSMAFYKDVALNWKGTGLLWLLILVIACWLPLFVSMQISVNQYFSTHGKALASQIPTITITDGKASVDAPQPLTIKEPMTGEIIAVIDTTGQINSLAETQARVLMTQTEVMMEKSSFENRSFSFEEIDQFTLDQSTVDSLFAAFTKYGPICLSVFVTVFMYLFRIFQVMIYALIAMIFANSHSVKLSYASLMRLSVMAITPTLIVNTLLVFLPISLPFHGLINFMVALLILYFVVKAVSQDQIDQQQNEYDFVPPTQPGQQTEPWDAQSYNDRNIPPQS